MNLRQKYLNTLRTCEDFKLVHDNNKQNYRVWIQEFKRKSALLKKSRRDGNSRQKIEEIRRDLKVLQESMVAARNHLDAAFQGHVTMVEDYLGPKLVSNLQNAGEMFIPEDCEFDDEAFSTNSYSQSFQLKFQRFLKTKTFILKEF